MTEKIQIRIENILDKKTSKGKPYKVLRNNGDGFFVWDSKLMEGIAEYDEVELEHDGGKYPKVSKIIKLEGFEAEEPVKKGSAGKTESGTNARTALITAKEMVIATTAFGSDTSKDDLTQEIIKQAKVFKNFLNDNE